MHWGIRSAARRLGYKVEISNIFTENQSVDLAKYDAVLIPGGADIDPKYYKNKVPEELKKHIESLDD